jgi:ribonuclease P protein component
MGSQQFTKAQRLLTATDYSNVFDNNSLRVSARHFLILAYKKPDNESGRLGLVIAKKNVKLASQRNRIKRLIRESFRLRQNELKELDIVVLARRGLDQKNNTQISDELTRLWNALLSKKAKS